MAMSLFKSKDNKYISDNLDRLCGQPAWVDDYLWMWKLESGIWNYCMGVSMRIFKTEDMCNLLSGLQFGNANDLEDRMIRNPIEKPYVVGSTEIKIVNFDVNIVFPKSRVTKIHLTNNQDVDILNDKWLNGYKIDSSPLGDLRKDTYQFLNTKFDFIGI